MADTKTNVAAPQENEPPKTQKCTSTTDQEAKPQENDKPQDTTNPDNNNQNSTPYSDGPKDGGKGFKEKTNNALHNTEGCMNEVLNTTDDKVGKPVVGFTEKIGASFKKWFKL